MSANLKNDTNRRGHSPKRAMRRTPLVARKYMPTGDRAMPSNRLGQVVPAQVRPATAMYSVPELASQGISMPAAGHCSAYLLNMTKDSLKFIVTAVQYSGTSYIAQVLQSAGVRAGQEKIFGGWGTFNPPYEVEVSWLAASHLSMLELKPYKKIHIVRKPLPTIQSLFNMGSNINSAIAHYINWNRMIETHKPAYRHRVEDDPMKLLNYMGYNANPAVLFNNKNYNSKKRFQKKVITHVDIKSSPNVDELSMISKDYGYALEW